MVLVHSDVRSVKRVPTIGGCFSRPIAAAGSRGATAHGGGGAPSTERATAFGRRALPAGHRPAATAYYCHQPPAVRSRQQDLVYYSLAQPPNECFQRVCESSRTEEDHSSFDFIFTKK